MAQYDRAVIQNVDELCITMTHRLLLLISDTEESKVEHMPSPLPFPLPSPDAFLCYNKAGSLELK